MIPALVLTAGLATRLRPLSLVRAKAAMPVGGEPIVRRILRGLRASGIQEAVLNLHHLPHTITRWSATAATSTCEFGYSWEQPVLGSAGGPRQALPLLDSRCVPDCERRHPDGCRRRRASRGSQTNLARSSRWPSCRRWKARNTAACASTTDGVVTGFTKRGSTEPSYHFVGVQVVEARAFASIAPGVPAESVSEVYPALIAADRGSVRAYICEAQFFDIGTPDDYLRTSLHCSTTRSRAQQTRGSSAKIDRTARVEDSILWDDVEVGAGSRLRRCIVTDGVHVPDGTSWTGVTLRRADGESSPGEKLIDGLAIGRFRQCITSTRLRNGCSIRTQLGRCRRAVIARSTSSSRPLRARRGEGCSAYRRRVGSSIFPHSFPRRAATGARRPSRGD